MLKLHFDSEGQILLLFEFFFKLKTLYSIIAVLKCKKKKKKTVCLRRETARLASVLHHKCSKKSPRTIILITSG